MAIQGNAFALLDDDVDAETLLVRLSTSGVEPPSQVDKRKANNKKAPSTAAPQRSFNNEKGRPGSERNNKNGFERQTKATGLGYNNNRDGVERHNRNRAGSNGGQENGFRQDGRGGAVVKSNNAYRHDEKRPAANGLKRNEGNSNGHYYRKKQETANGDTNAHQKKQETTNDLQNKQETTNGATEEKEGTDEKKEGTDEKKEGTDDEGWQIVRRSNGHKQKNVYQQEASREGNVSGRQRNHVGRRGFNNGNEGKVVENGEKGVSGGFVEKSADGKYENEHRIRNGGNGRANRGGYGRGGERGANRVRYQQRRAESAPEGEENGKSSEPTEVVNENEVQKGSDDGNVEPEGDETASNKGSSKGDHDAAPSQEEIERTAARMARKKELEEEAKKMTLKQYEKALEEKRKALESLKTEERRVALDKELESMHVIERKNEEINSVKLNSVNDKLKKKVVNNNNNNNNNNNAPKVKNNLFRHPTGGRGGRYPNRNGTSQGAVKTPAIPLPSIEDAKQFPALA